MPLLLGLAVFFRNRIDLSKIHLRRPVGLVSIQTRSTGDKRCPLSEMCAVYRENLASSSDDGETVTGTIMYEALLVIFLLIALGLIGLIMLQQGKGADMGASFGAGASATLFGSSGSGNFMTRMTAVLATLFFVLSLVLGNMSSHQSKGGSEWDNLGQPAQVEQPVTPAAPAAPASDIPK